MRIKKPAEQGPLIQEGRMAEYIQKKKRHTLGRLIIYFKYYPGMTAITILLAIISNLVVVAKPFILAKVIDDNLQTGLNDMNSIVQYALLYLALVITGVVTDYSQSLMLSSLGQRIMHKLRTNLFTHVQHFSMGFFDHNSSGSILTRISSDVESLSDLYSNVIVSFVRDALLIVSVLYAMFAMNLQLATFSLTVIPVIFAVTVGYRYIARRNFIKIKSQLSKLNGFLAENIIGMRIVQIFGRQEHKKQEFHKLSREYYRLGVIEIVLNSLSNPLLNAIGNLSVAAMIAFFAKDALTGVLAVGILYAFTTYIKQFVGPISRIAEQFTTIQSALISADRIFDMVDNLQDQEDMGIGRRIQSLKGDIEFENVWFAYEGEHWVLKDISFKISAGQTAAFVGATGSGKTTIISLLARFYKIQQGRILIDGIDINEYNLSDLRRQVAVVMQDVFLFSGDISYNIRLNEERITNEEVVQAATFVSANEFIDKLPDRYDQVVSERGSSFSAGQRQLIAFARAVAFQPSVLVLDEATASIDTETEAMLKNALAKATSGRTSIIIAHRLSTITGADCIFVMKCGRIRESGKHSELMEKQGIYAKLYELSLKTGTGL